MFSSSFCISAQLPRIPGRAFEHGSDLCSFPSGCQAVRRHEPSLPPSHPLFHLTHRPCLGLTENVAASPFLVATSPLHKRLPTWFHFGPRCISSTHNGNLAATAKHDPPVLTLKWPLNLEVSSGHLRIPVKDPTHQVGTPPCTTWRKTVMLDSSCGHS